MIDIMAEKQNLPRVGIVNCVSQALEMLRFSSEQLIENAGTDDFDYIIVCWHATPAVDAYIARLQEKYTKTHPRLRVIRVEHKENSRIGFVPNLRAMINEGLVESFKRNLYAGLVNTDQAFYKNWLVNLVKYCSPKTIVSAVAVAPNIIPPHHRAEFGVTEYDKFDLEGFFRFCERISRPGVILTEEVIRGQESMDFNNLIGLPYLHSRELWEKAGPWEVRITTGTPDRNFFKRAHKKGFNFALSLDSIAYHMGGAERRAEKRTPPEFAKHMEYEPIALWSRALLRAKISFYGSLKKLGFVKKEVII